MKVLSIANCVLLSLSLCGAAEPGAAAGGGRIVIGMSPSLTATLNVIAEKQGYFAQEGVDVELRLIDSGSRAVAMMLRDEIDISESAIFQHVLNSFDRRDFRILAEVSVAGNDNMIIARRDRGIKEVKDLKGKTVGVLKNGFPQYVLDLMLLNAGMTSKDVHIVPEESSDLARRLAANEFDAFCNYGGWVDAAIKTLNTNGIVFHDANIARVTVVQAGKRGTFERRPDVFPRLLRALIKAETYVKKNPADALDTVVAHLKLDMQNARKVWKPNLLHVGLDQSLVKDMENLARWQIETGLRASAKIPNCLELIEFDFLRQVDRKRVTIIN